MNRCKHKKAKLIDARFQVFWCRTCGAIKTPSAVTSGRYQWLSPQFARDRWKEKNRAGDTQVQTEDQTNRSSSPQP